MANDISISVRVDNQTASGLAAVNTSLRSLRQNATTSGQAVTTLTTRFAAAAVAARALDDAIEELNQSLRALHGRAAAAAGEVSGLRDRSTQLNNSFRTLNTRTDTGATRLGDLSDRTRTLRSDMDDLDGVVTRVGGNMNNLRGRLSTLTTSTDSSAEGMDSLRFSALSLKSALIPVAAAGAPIAASMAAAIAATMAFGAALIPQAKALGEAAEAEKKYQDAVKEHGRGSAEAAKAEATYMQRVQQLPPATREAAAALSAMKGQYEDWSDSLSDDTMPVATKSFETFSALFPKISPLVRGASGELDRFMTLVAGGVNSSEFDAFADRVSTFSTGALRSANDGLVHLMRVMSQGDAGKSGLAQFMEYAHANGPVVAETLTGIGRALAHLLLAASDVGVGLLQVVNALAKLVSAAPTGLITVLLQLVVAFKAVRLAAAGLVAVNAAVAAFGAQITAMQVAAGGATGRLGALTAAFGALSSGAKLALVATGVGVLLVALTQLSQIGQRTPPDVDRLTTSLGRLGESGKISGEAARAFGSDLSGLADSLRTLSRPGTLDSIQQFMTGLVGMDSTPVKEAKEDLNAVDEALANLVKGGNSELAEAAFQRAAAAMRDQGLSAEELRGRLDGFKSALADQAFAQQLAAQGMGLFGEQAVATAAKLDAQKGSADGLRQSIQALNDAQRAGLGGMIGFEAAIDAVAVAAQQNAGSLTMIGGNLDLNSEKARAAATALQDLASKTDAAAASARESGASWSAVNGIYDRGRASLLASAQAMGLTRAQAERLAAQILQTPDKTARLKGNMEDLQAKLDSAKSQLKNVPDSRRAALLARIDQLQAAVASAKAQLASIHDKTVTITTYRNLVELPQPGLLGQLQRRASGGPVHGPGTGTSDDVPLMASNGEYVIQTRAVKKYGTRFLDAINQGVLGTFAKGGKVSEEARRARSEMAGDLTVSHFGRMAGRRRSEFAAAMDNPNDLGALAQSLNKWRGLIDNAFSGGVERRLLGALDRTGAQLIKQEKALTKVNSALDGARDKLKGLRDKAAQVKDSVSSGVMSAANITGTAQGGARTTIGKVMNDLLSNRDKAVSFAAALKELKARGLNSGSLQEIANAGIEGGGLSTAEALLSARGSDLHRINDLRSEIGAAAGAAGRTTADAMYGAGIKAAEKLVKGLERQQERLQRAMERVAAALERTLEKALGIKGRAHGGIIGAAGGGPRSALTWVGEQGPELVSLPFGSRVRTAGDSRRLAAGGSDGGLMVIQLNIAGKSFGDLVIDTARREVRTRGGDVQAVLGRAS
ncbi:phage tail protein [Streptomyces sp. AV19]|uniref:phage tail protein n=1 Tax=Streptomyces sp. AV19 TaxID=2793068 RepID=UPI00241355D4|nr:phage tail protein [Streptomyces sp. AV19]MDG4535333.1 phage tail protein [Streptomyces sp. AV19]